MIITVTVKSARKSHKYKQTNCKNHKKGQLCPFLFRFCILLLSEGVIANDFALSDLPKQPVQGSSCCYCKILLINFFFEEISLQTRNLKRSTFNAKNLQCNLLWKQDKFNLSSKNLRLK